MGENYKQQLLEIQRQLDEIKEQIKPKEKEILSSDDLIAWLGISRQTINRWKKTGELTAYFIGGKMFFKRSEIMETMNNSKSKP